MDEGLRQELISIIEKLTHSGLPSLDQELLKRLKTLCKSSDACIRATHDTVMTHLALNHAEIRLSAFQIIDDLFRRSHLFRELLLSDFQKFSSLVTGTDPRQPLPLPKMVAGKLKEKSLLAIRQWHDKFGEGYPRLKLSYNYLKINKKVNFDQLVAQSEAVRRRQQEREARQAAMLQQRVRDIKQEMNEVRLDIEDCLAQVESCFNLLVPRFDMPDIFASAESNETRSGLERPSQDSEHVVEPVIEQQGGERARKRNRTESSCSFVSLSSGGEPSEVEDDCICDKEREGVVSPVLTVGDGEKRGVVSPVLPVGNEEKEGVVSPVLLAGDEERESVVSSMLQAGDDEERKKDERMGEDDDFLDHLYTSSSSVSHGRKLGVAVVSSSAGKGKGKLKEENVTRETRIAEESFRSESSCDSDTSSEVEWEDVPVSRPETHDQIATDLQEHGLTSRGFCIPITIELSSQPEVRETEDNTSIIATLLECKQLLSETYLPKINKWMGWMTKSGGEEDNLRKAIDFKNKVMATLNKFQRLRVIYTNPPASKKPREDNPVEQLPDKPKPRHHVTPDEWQFGGSHSSIPHSDVEQDPTTPEAQLVRLKTKLDARGRAGRKDSPLVSSESTKRAAGKLSGEAAVAPVVPFGMDLYYWDNPKDVEPMTLAPVGSLHRFWAQEHEVSISEEEKARLRCRAITYAGEFEPVQRSCRAPLPSGNLCPRKDRIKCPFHGVIIPRDERGDPVKTSSSDVSQPSGTSGQLEAGDVQSSSKEAKELWRDIELQSEIMAAAKFKMESKQDGTKKRRGRKRGEKKIKYPGLTDLKVHTDTPRKRLEKKVLNKRSLKRIAEVHEKAAAKQYQDKFGYNFNYALKS